MARSFRQVFESSEERSSGEDPFVAPLRLTATRGQLGLELYQALFAGPVELSSLSLSLPGLAFPLDLSGGVQAFRHRRGRLEQMRLRITAYDLERWLKGTWRSALGGRLETPDVWVSSRGIQIGALGADGALAFEVLWAPDGRGVRLIVANARGAGKVGVSLARAIELLESALSGVATRRGRAFLIPDLGGTIGRRLLPEVGARAPDSSFVRISALAPDSDSVSVLLDSALTAPILADDTLRSLELCELARDADDALISGELDASRRLYLSLLERAPRHPEIVKLIAEIDWWAGKRDEAALGLIVETMQPTSAGSIGAELLFKAGDLDAARAALELAARSEVYAPLAALWYLRLSELESEAWRKQSALNQAVASAPGLGAPRFARLRERAFSGDVDGVLADAEHLEAAAKGSQARHQVLLSAAGILLGQGYVRDAGRLFERALRYVPDDAQATAGLGRSLIETGDFRRAIVLLERAILLGARSGRPPADALVDLARVLAEEIGDLPQAIARVREVSHDSSRAAEARALEASWRARLGDVVGASLAYARLRQQLELSPPARAELAAEWLERAADFEADVQRDLAAAERHLATLLRLLPHDSSVQDSYRALAARLAREARAALGSPTGSMNEPRPERPSSKG